MRSMFKIESLTKNVDSRFFNLYKQSQIIEFLNLHHVHKILIKTSKT